MNISELNRTIEFAEQNLCTAENSLRMSTISHKIEYWADAVKKYKQELEGLYALRDTAGKKPIIKVTALSILQNAAGHMEDRAATYDNPEGERSIPKVIEIFNILRGTNLTPADGWLIQVLLKIVRANQGDFKLDNFEDLAAYAALWAEEASHANEQH